MLSFVAVHLFVTRSGEQLYGGVGVVVLENDCTGEGSV